MKVKEESEKVGLLLCHFSRVWLCATPQTAAHQAPPSLGFSKQEHWSGLPFPSPTYESEKWKWKWNWSRVRLLSTPWTAAYQAPPSMGFSRQEYCSGVPLPSPGLKLHIQKTKLMASGPNTSWEIDGETVETVSDFILGGLQNHCRWWLKPWN